MFWKSLGTHFDVGFALQNINNKNKVFQAKNWYNAVASVGNTGLCPLTVITKQRTL
jgi:hypothetical protein